jgi:hypothetical protein
MLSSLLRPKKPRQRVEEPSPFSSPYPEPDRSSPTVARRERQIRHATADWTETEAEDENTEDDQDEEEVIGDEDAHGNGAEDGDEDGGDDTPLLPIFSAAHLGQSYVLYPNSIRMFANMKQTHSPFTASLMRSD